MAFSRPGVRSSPAPPFCFANQRVKLGYGFAEMNSVNSLRSSTVVSLYKSEAGQ